MTLLKLDFFFLCHPLSLPHFVPSSVFLSLFQQLFSTVTVKKKPPYVSSNKELALSASDAASDGGALYNRASVFAASLWVCVGCNINSITQLCYQQAHEHSLVCAPTQTHTHTHTGDLQCMHTHMHKHSLADTYGELVVVRAASSYLSLTTWATWILTSQWLCCVNYWKLDNSFWIINSMTTMLCTGILEGMCSGTLIW